MLQAAFFVGIDEGSAFLLLPYPSFQSHYSTIAMDLRATKEGFTVHLLCTYCAFTVHLLCH